MSLLTYLLSKTTHLLYELAHTVSMGSGILHPDNCMDSEDNLQGQRDEEGKNAGR